MFPEMADDGKGEENTRLAAATSGGTRKMSRRGAEGTSNNTEAVVGASTFATFRFSFFTTIVCAYRRRAHREGVSVKQDSR